MKRVFSSESILSRVILTKRRFITIMVICIKILVMVFSPPTGDFINWAGGASFVFGLLVTGRFPPIAATGVYVSLFLVLAPFFWVWKALPIDHPPLQSLLFSTSSPAVLLAVLLKAPILICDIATGILLCRLVREITHSEHKGRIASLVWYANPFNIYWIEAFGGMDVIPTFLLVLGIVLATSKKWFRCGISLSVGTLLRIFPLFIFPYFLLAVNKRTTRHYVLLIAGFLIPLIIALCAVYSAKAGTLTTILNLPGIWHQFWLLDFLGWDITNQFTKTTLVLLVVQFFIAAEFWRKPNLIHLATVSLLAIYTGALAYGGTAQHFIWGSALLSACVALNSDESWIFILTFVTGSLYLTPIVGVATIPPVLYDLTMSFIGGTFYAAKAGYLVKINLENLHRSGFRLPQLRT